MGEATGQPAVALGAPCPEQTDEAVVMHDVGKWPGYWLGEHGANDGRLARIRPDLNRQDGPMFAPWCPTCSSRMLLGPRRILAIEPHPTGT